MKGLLIVVVTWAICMWRLANPGHAVTLQLVAIDACHMWVTVMATLLVQRVLAEVRGYRPSGFLDHAIVIGCGSLGCRYFWALIVPTIIEGIVGHSQGWF